MRNFSPITKVFIAMVVVSGAAVLFKALMHPQPVNLIEFLALLIISVVASRLRVKIPGVTGTMSVNLPFILIGVALMGTAEALIIGCASTLAQCLPRAGKKFNWIQGVFNVANMALTVEASRLIYGSTTLNSIITSHSLLLCVAGAGFFAVNTVPVAVVIALTEKKNMLRAWLPMFQLSFPYYLGSAGVAGVAITVSNHLGWQGPLLVLPLMLGVFYSYRRYFSATATVEKVENKRPVQSAAATPAASAAKG
jgi:hypothetical protein